MVIDDAGFDAIVAGGRVIDPANAVDAVCDIACDMQGNVFVTGAQDNIAMENGIIRGWDGIGVSATNSANGTFRELIVCKNLEGIGGQILLHSNAGKGTMVQLHIPLTTAIVDGMLIRVENRIYAIPMLDIQETRQVEDGQVVQIVDGDEVIQIRGVLYPVIRLREYHNLSFDKKSLNEGLVVLSQTGGQRIAIFVDELIEQKQLVIKPIPSYLGRIPGVSGCTILGSSDICLVLDVLGMVRELQD